MRKILNSIIICAALLLTAWACQKEAPAASDMEQVTFTVALPEEIATRSIADGAKAAVLYYATYTDQGRYLASLSEVSRGVAPTAAGSKTFKVTLNLVKDIPYDVVFWAQDPDCEAFSFDWDGPAPTVKVSYDGAANDDGRDAFYRKATVKVPFASEDDKTIRLYRPFAQINFGASDYDPISEYYSETEVDEGMTSGLDIEAEVPSVMNLLTGATSETVPAGFDLEAIPNGDDKTLVVGSAQYRYVSMNYVLAPSGESDSPAVFKSLTGTFVLTIDGQKKLERKVTVTNVPYLRNHRTNIVGDLFTEDAELTVVIENRFDDPDLKPADGSVTIR